MGKLGKSWIYKDFRETLTERFGFSRTEELWEKANTALAELEVRHPDITGDSKMMVLPAAALYRVLSQRIPNEALDMLKRYGTETGERIAEKIHGVTSIPGVSRLLWKNMPKLMRTMSSEKKGYRRKIVSESQELVAVDILSCPLHEAAVKIGMPEIAQVVCAMDKAYMTGFKYIQYTRTTSVAEGGSCCDYRLSFDKKKK